MVRTLEREDLRANSGSRTEEHVVRRPTPSVEEVRASVEGPRRPIRWMRWLGVSAILALVVVIATGDRATERVAEFRTADWWERMLTPAVVVGPAIESHTADYLDRLLSPEASAFHTADYLDRATG